MIDAARNRLRVKACYVMIATTLGACVLMVIQGKRVSDNRRVHCVPMLFFFLCSHVEVTFLLSKCYCFYMYFRLNLIMYINMYFVLVLQAARRHESLAGQNMERKAKWKEEGEKEKDAAVALSQKAQ